MIRTHKLGLVGVVEAKLRLENVEKTCFLAQWSYAHNGFPGRVARILVGWDSQLLLLQVDVIHTSSQLLLTKVTTVDTRVFYASWVYGNNLIGDRRSLWGEMISLASSIGTTPWIQLGDFNVVRWRSERFVGFDVGAASEFNACLIVLVWMICLPKVCGLPGQTRGVAQGILRAS
ncbi:hypothetical protein Vadar_014134 [Vaccinium darrowii]|uniref:Uncharacterized protein n=1 Tax=Vaccinium darrowii TaxID=229202 RepID=A0ACB7ZJH0_9ERIC|nr:hypothetical protein Vadar_014134 [Vaccinium darrowii]